MKLQVILGLCLTVTIAAQRWTPGIPHGPAGDMGRQYQEAGLGIDRSDVRCFGLSRRTRTQTIQRPYLYNVKTGQSAPVPSFLFSAENWVIQQMENEGWEVRTRTMNVPKHIYDRVPVCCPWERQCNHARQPQVLSRVSGTGPCANGGQLIYRDGQQKCECPPGFGGPWCEITEGMSAGQPFPTGPLARVKVTQGPFSGMVREADLWRQRVLQNLQGGQLSHGGASMLSAQDHLLASVAGPWAHQAAMWNQDAMRSKMAQEMGHAQMVQAQIAQAAQTHFGRGQLQQHDLSPVNIMKAMQQSGGNPYSLMDPRAIALAKQSAFQEGAMRGYLAELARQELQKQQLQQHRQQAVNPYSHRSLDITDPNIQALLRMHNLQPSGENPFAAVPPRRPGMSGSRMGDNPYDRVRPFGPTTGLQSPRARTPWDLDPFNKQAPPFMRGQTSDRQMMAMAMYQHLMSHHQPETRPNQPGPGYPEERMPPMVRDFQPEILMRPNNEQLQQNQASDRWSAPKPEEMPAADMVPQLDGSLETESIADGSEMPPQGPPNSMMNDLENMNDPNMPPMSGSPAIPMSEQQPGMMMPPQAPSPEEIQKLQQCQETLTPKIDQCLQGHQISLEQFMNPEFMATARTVCRDNIAIGQCIKQLDSACGQSEGMTVTMTRQILTSVLQMMTMVCRQIEARGEAEIPPLQTQHGGPSDQVVGEREPIETPQEENVPGPARDDLPAFLGQDTEPVPELDATAQPETKTEETNPKLDNSNGHVTENEPEPGSAATQSQSGHDHAQPVSSETKMFGLPLWLVIFVGLVSLSVLLLATIIACLCVRRQKRKKVDIEIEKMPSPLDGKLYTVGIPPPSYTTAAVPQTQDGLNLPPLDLVDGSVMVPVDDEDDKKGNDEKPRLEASDADDESDEKDIEEGGKKKKHGEKKGDRTTRSIDV